MTQPPSGNPVQPPSDTQASSWPPQSPSGPAQAPSWPPQSPWAPAHLPPPGYGAAPSGGIGRDWRIAVAAIAAGVLAVAGVLVYVLGDSTSAAPRARLERALLATNSAGTADLAMNVEASTEGFSFGVTATGTVDFSTQAASLHVSLLGQALSVVETDGSAYIKDGTLVSSKFPGKTWMRIPVAALTSGQDSQLFVTSDPAKAMAALLKLGASVTPIGTATVDGSQDQGYSIHLTLADLEAHASELPPSFRSLIATARTSPSATAAMSTTMYVDQSGQLQAVHVVVTAKATGHPVTASIDLTLSHFGTAAAPVAPPGTQTVTYQQLKGTLGSGALPLNSLSGGAQTAA